MHVCFLSFFFFFFFFFDGVPNEMSRRCLRSTGQDNTNDRFVNERSKKVKTKKEIFGLKVKIGRGLNFICGPQVVRESDFEHS